MTSHTGFGRCRSGKYVIPKGSKLAWGFFDPEKNIDPGANHGKLFSDLGKDVWYYSFYDSHEKIYRVFLVQEPSFEIGTRVRITKDLIVEECYSKGYPETFSSLNEKAMEFLASHQRFFDPELINRTKYHQRMVSLCGLNGILFFQSFPNAFMRNPEFLEKPFVRDLRKKTPEEIFSMDLPRDGLPFGLDQL